MSSWRVRHAMVNYWQRSKAVAESDEAAAMRVLKKVQCHRLRDQPWGFLSQGERQRLLIGRALMSPRLDALILDEPCAGLDPMARENFLKFIQELTRKRAFRSLIMVTHHVEEIVPAITPRHHFAGRKIGRFGSEERGADLGKFVDRVWWRATVAIPGRAVLYRLCGGRINWRRESNIGAKERN